MPSLFTIAASATLIVMVVATVARGRGLLSAFHHGDDGLSYDVRMLCAAVAIVLLAAGLRHRHDWFGPVLLDATGALILAYFWASTWRRWRRER